VLDVEQNHHLIAAVSLLRLDTLSGSNNEIVINQFPKAKLPSDAEIRTRQNVALLSQGCTTSQAGPAAIAASKARDRSGCDARGDA
jgi:hypothetical protein